MILTVLPIVVKWVVTRKGCELTYIAHKLFHNRDFTFPHSPQNRISHPCVVDDVALSSTQHFVLHYGTCEVANRDFTWGSHHMRPTHNTRQFWYINCNSGPMLNNNNIVCFAQGSRLQIAGLLGKKCELTYIYQELFLLNWSGTG